MTYGVVNSTSFFKRVKGEIVDLEISLLKMSPLDVCNDALMKRINTLNSVLKHENNTELTPPGLHALAKVTNCLEYLKPQKPPYFQSLENGRSDETVRLAGKRYDAEDAEGKDITSELKVLGKHQVEFEKAMTQMHAELKRLEKPYMLPNGCECGAQKCGTPHSHWCPAKDTVAAPRANAHLVYTESVKLKYEPAGQDAAKALCVCGINRMANVRFHYDSCGYKANYMKQIERPITFDELRVRGPNGEELTIRADPSLDQHGRVYRVEARPQGI